MSNAELINKVAGLPEDLKFEVVKFIESLLTEEGNIAAYSKPIFGSGKGLFVMAEDFDAPLDDFKDYV